MHLSLEVELDSHHERSSFVLAVVIDGAAKELACVVSTHQPTCDGSKRGVKM
jgi:hypothetical protein